MASDDIYLRKDVYEADQRALIAEIRLGNGEILRVIDQFKAEINSKFDQFRGEVNSQFGEVNSRFDKLEARVDVLAGRMDGLEHRMSSLEGYVGNGIAFIGIVVTLLVFIEPVAKRIRRIFKHEKPLTREDVEAIIDAKLQARQ